jgi:hypothetical protein
MFHDQVEITAGGFFVVDVRLIFCVSYQSARIFSLSSKIMVDHCRLWNSHGRRVAVVDIRQTRLLPCDLNQGICYHMNCVCVSN